MWNVLGRGDQDKTCPTCGDELKPERRRPGRRFVEKLGERRDQMAGAQPVRPAK